MRNMARFGAGTALVLILMLSLGGCNGSAAAEVEPDEPDYAGRYVGYSWGGEARGTTFEDRDRFIETILTLDRDGTILDADMRYWVMANGFWTTRQSGNAYVDVDYSVTPVAATPGSDYQAGTSMFTVYTADMMSFYGVGVSDDGVVATGIVCPVTRYLYETRLPRGFNYDRPMSDITVGSDYLVPTVRTSGSGLVRPEDWQSLAGETIFSIHHWSHVVNDTGILEGISNQSSVREYLEALGVSFDNGRPVPMNVTYGFFGVGGWHGNYRSMEAFLRGRNATEYTSLVDWSIPRYAGAINDDNVFGVDVGSGATRTAQDSMDGMSGATVRLSREATSYQRALVAAGILDESDVIIGRF